MLIPRNTVERQTIVSTIEYHTVIAHSKKYCLMAVDMLSDYAQCNITMVDMT